MLSLSTTTKPTLQATVTMKRNICSSKPNKRNQIKVHLLNLTLKYFYLKIFDHVLLFLVFSPLKSRLPLAPLVHLLV